MTGVNATENAVEYVEHLFNTCPECRPNGKRVALTWKKSEEYTMPCDNCGCRFGKILAPKTKAYGEGYRLGKSGIHNNGTSKT